VPAANADDVPGTVVDVRAQALLIGPLRLALAAGGVALARARGVEGGVAAGLFALGLGLLLVAVASDTRRRRSGWARIAEAEPAPAGIKAEPRWRSLAAATYPSTIGLTVLTAIALWLNPDLAAVLAGILGGLGVAALVSAAQLVSWEQQRRARLLAERGGGKRVFLRS
jgi:hypothetical protein